MLTYKFWHESLHSDASVLGKTVRLESCCGARTATIVGVLEPSVPYPVETEFIANVVTSPHHLVGNDGDGARAPDDGGLCAAERRARRWSRRAPSCIRVYAAMTAAHPEVYKPEDHFQIQRDADA